MTHSCPLCSPFGHNPAFQALQAQLQEDEHLFAFLDDVCVVCSLDQVNAIFGLLQNALFIHSAIRVHHGTTQVWNRGGAVARITDPEDIVQRGDAISRVRTKACGFWAQFGAPRSRPRPVAIFICDKRPVDRGPHVARFAGHVNFWGLTPALCIGIWPVFG